MIAHIQPNFRRVVTGAAGKTSSSSMTSILAAVLSVKFFEKSHSVAALPVTSG
jgi:hypothetical protein